MAANPHSPPESVLAVLLRAAAHGSSVEEAARSLDAVPHPNTVRLTLRKMTVQSVEQEVNEGLLNRPVRRLLKRPLEIACDLKYIPYGGQAAKGEADFVWKGRAFRGTTRYFVYATLHVIKKGQRFTLAVRACRKKEGLVGALRWLLQRFCGRCRLCVMGWKGFMGL